MDRVTIILLVAIAIAVLALFLWYQRKPQAAPRKRRPRTTVPSEHEVVGSIVPPSTKPTMMVTGPVINTSSSNIEYPVGTLLVQNAPPAVQAELLLKVPQGALQGIAVPDTFDCREKWPGLISNAYHQGSCGSCWAFASAMAVSDRIRIVNPDDKELRIRFMYRPFVPPSSNGTTIAYPVLNNMSPYYLVSCDTCGKTFSTFPKATEYVTGPDLQCNGGCEGGYLQLVYDFMMKSGVPSLYTSPTDCDPTIQDCPCSSVENMACDPHIHNDCPSQCDQPLPQECIRPRKIYRPKQVYSLVAPNESKEIRRRRIMEDIYERGPVTIGFAVYQSFYDFFANNPKGVYSNLVRPQNDRPIGGHAVDIVGWGTDENGTFYWTMRNSWGESWGDLGFFKMQYDFEGILENVMACEA